GAAGIADELVGALDHAVALAGGSRKHLAGAGDLEPLLGGRLGLHLGHFACLLIGRIALVFAPDRPKSGKQAKPPRHALPGGFHERRVYTAKWTEAQHLAVAANARRSASAPPSAERLRRTDPRTSCQIRPDAILQPNR